MYPLGWAMDVRKAWSLAVLSFVLGSGLRTARADSTGRTAVIVVEGGGNDVAVASQIAAHIDAPHAVRDSKPFLAALAARGTRALAPAVGNRAADSQLIARAHAAASDAHVDVVILVTHRKNRRAVRGHLWVIDARQEGAVVDQDLAPGAAANDEADAAWTASASLFAAAPPGPPPEASPPPAAPASPPASQDLSAAATTTPAPIDRAQASPEESASEGRTRRTALLVLQANLEAGSRHVSYVDRITPSLRPYDLFAAPLASIAAEVYPLTRTRMPAVVRGLGVTGDYARAFGLASADAGGVEVGTAWQAYDFGLRDRVDLGGALLLGVDLGYGAIDFDFDRPGFAAVLPSVGYRFLRAGLDLRSHGDLAVFGGGGYLDVLSTGNMGGLFPRESVGGVEARLGAAYSVAAGFELSLGVSYTRFFYSMHPQPGDANVAGGVLDEMARVSLGLAYLL
jgi:hypothetical protein